LQFFQCEAQLRPAARGIDLAFLSAMVKRLDDLIAFQQAVAFKREVYTIVAKHPRADRSFRYRDQLFDAASGVESNIAEGWRRFSTGDMIRFFRYATSSLEEARVRLLDGVDRGYFNCEVCANALVHARRCGAATTGLIKSLEEND
jgi:four helix bundle protein